MMEWIFVKGVYVTYNHHYIICFIPMRKNSKRLKNKNIKPLNGKPLYQYTIDAALQSSYIDKIIINTDYDNIFPKEEKILYYRRPQHLCGEDISTEEVVKEMFSREDIKNPSSMVLILLQVTSPLRTVYDIDNAIKLFFEHNQRPVYSVSKSNRGKPNGAIYIQRIQNLLKGGGFFADNFTQYVMDGVRCIDIDYENDFNMVIKMMENDKGSNF